MKDYHNGPVSGTSCSDADERRSCTDLYCFIILVLFVISMLVVGIIAWSGNNFSKLSTPYDSEGKGCGVDYPGYPYIYFVSPHYDVTGSEDLEFVENSLFKGVPQGRGESARMPAQ